MKILNAIYAQNIGGVNQVFCDYSEVLTKSGHEVALLISDNGFDNYKAKKIFKLKNFGQIFDCLHLLWILLTFRPEVVFCHSGRVTKWLRVLRFIYRPKVFFINHGTTFKFSFNCDYAISVNQKISQSLIDAGFDTKKSFVIANAVKIDQQYKEKTLKVVPVIGIYGRIEAAKGFDILLKAAAILAKKNRDFILKIGGFDVKGSEYNLEYIKNLAAKYQIDEKCNFVGTVTDKEKFFADLDILAVPSREETFGLPILESFLFSTLVVASDTDGGSLLIKDGDNGLLCLKDNPEHLSQKIEQILDNPSLYNLLTKSAFLYLQSNFSFDFLQGELDKIIKNLKS